jgi:hypothetical protein
MSPLALSPERVDIVDIRESDLEFSLANEIQKGLNPPDGTRRSMPTMLLYDSEGLKLFEKITYLEEYYLTNAEIEVLETHSRRLVERIPSNAQLLELGSGYVVFPPFIGSNQLLQYLTPSQKPSENRNPPSRVRACRQTCRLLCPRSLSIGTRENFRQRPR